jgi:hypothetical protein
VIDPRSSGRVRREAQERVHRISTLHCSVNARCPLLPLSARARCAPAPPRWNSLRASSKRPSLARRSPRRYPTIPRVHLAQQAPRIIYVEPEAGHGLDRRTSCGPRARSLEMPSWIRHVRRKPAAPSGRNGRVASTPTRGIRCTSARMLARPASTTDTNGRWPNLPGPGPGGVE